MYSYDSATRVTMIQKYPHGQANAEDTCQQVTYAYGTNAAVFNYSRLQETQYHVCIAGQSPMTFLEDYSYNAAGAVTQKLWALSRNEAFWYGGTSPVGRSVAVNYGYTNWGAVSSVSYPMATVDRMATAIQFCYGQVRSSGNRSRTTPANG